MADDADARDRQGPGSHPLLVTDIADPSIPRVPHVDDLPGKVLAVKEAETFLYSDARGNLNDRRELGHGLYYRDTRYLSGLHLRISGREPILLSSTAERVYISSVDLTNPELLADGHPAVAQHSLSIRRLRTVRDRLYERIRLKNYNGFPVGVRVELRFAADFHDIFEIRGLTLEERGTAHPPRLYGDGIEFSYLGMDGVRRTTLVHFQLPPRDLIAEGGTVVATFDVHLQGHETKTIPFAVEPVLDGRRSAEAPFDEVVNQLRRSYEDWERDCTRVRTDNALFDRLLGRGLRDLRALYTPVDGGAVIAAGIPWYVAPFGRDTLITSHQMLMLSSRPARESLRALADHQGKTVDDWRDEEPGKILHEIRRGELAGAGFLPHTPYYGSVDATPWFLILLAQYFRWTNDLGFVKEMLPAAEAALAWIDTYGDVDGDGFVEYRSRSPRGLRNQGWKDAHDSVVHVDGSLADPPIALAEVQAYVFMAKARMADVFAALGDAERAVRLREQAAALRRRFNEAFWMPEEEYFAGALDADNRQVGTIVSNPGHGLYCGIIDDDKAGAIARRLFEPDMFSGWGIRTLGRNSSAYNPMSYHTGTVWPHDNALIAAGLKRYGFIDATNHIVTALFDAATFVEYMRLPELFCGFARRTPNPPVEYPVACSPQAWAAGAPFLLLQAMLGISAIANENLLTVNKPHLPPWLNSVELGGLHVGDSTLSLVFRREADTTSFSLISKEGDVRVVMEE